jgi:hypothetical protein
MLQGGATLEQATGRQALFNEAAGQPFTRRKTELVSFAAEESGMTAFFCSRYENRKGEAGDWGPVAQAVIP